MKTLKIDERWSVEYDETLNDQPVNLLRHNQRVFTGIDDWKNDHLAMFRALLEARANDIREVLKKSGPIEVDTSSQITRDMFAMVAPVSVADAAIACGYPDLHEALGKDADRTVVFAIMAQMRYEYADAMLKAREGV